MKVASASSSAVIARERERSARRRVSVAISKTDLRSASRIVGTSSASSTSTAIPTLTRPCRSARPRLVGGVQRREVAQGEGGRPDDHVVEGRDRLPALFLELGPQRRGRLHVDLRLECELGDRGAGLCHPLRDRPLRGRVRVPRWWRLSPRRRRPAPRPPPSGRRRRRCGRSGRCRRARPARRRARPRAAARRAWRGRDPASSGAGARAARPRSRRPALGRRRRTRADAALRMRAIGSPSAAVSPASTTISSSTPSVSAS